MPPFLRPLFVHLFEVLEQVLYYYPQIEPFPSFSIEPLALLDYAD